MFSFSGEFDINKRVVWLIVLQDIHHEYDIMGQTTNFNDAVSECHTIEFIFGKTELCQEKLYWVKLSKSRLNKMINVWITKETIRIVSVRQTDLHSKYYHKTIGI